MNHPIHLIFGHLTERLAGIFASEASFTCRAASLSNRQHRCTDLASDGRSTWVQQSGTCCPSQNFRKK